VDERTNLPPHPVPRSAGQDAGRTGGPAGGRRQGGAGSGARGPRAPPDNRARLRRLGRGPAGRPAGSLAVLSMVAAAAYYWLLLVDFAVLRSADSLSGYLDEIAVLFALPFAAIALLRPPPGALLAMLGFAAYAAAGIVSALFGPVSGYPFVLVTGLALALDAKPFVLMFAFAHVLRNAPDSSVMLPLLRSLIVIALINTPFALRDFLLSGGYSLYGAPLDLRAGFHRPHGLFHHATASVDVSLLGTMAAGAIWGVRKSSGMALLFGGLVLMTMLHLVVKEIVALVAITILIILSMRFRQRNMQILVRAVAVTLGLLLALPFAAYVAPIIQGRLSDYIEGGDDAIRTLMYLISVELAAQNLPFGTGFGTFGSLPSYTIFYSPIYDQTGLSQLYGASRAYPYYLQDVFWPKVLGESGWAGLLAYGGLYLFLMVRIVAASLRAISLEALFAALVLVSALIKSMAAATFTSDLFMLAVGLALAIAACYPRGFAAARAEHAAGGAGRTGPGPLRRSPRRPGPPGSMRQGSR